MSLLKDQYMLEYQERFEELKKSFFEQYKSDADFKLAQFQYDNIRDSLKFQYDKLYASFGSLKDWSIQNLIAYGLGLYNQWVQTPENYKAMDEFIAGNLTFDNTGGNTTVKFGPYSMTVNLLSESEIEKVRNWFVQNKSLLEKFKNDFYKFSQSYKAWNNASNSNGMVKRYFNDFENNLKAWIKKYQDAGVQVEAYEAMLEKARLASLSQAKEDTKIQTQDVPVQTVQTPAPTLPIPEKKSNLVPLLAAGAAAFLFLRGE